jgi:hypothetical protein
MDTGVKKISADSSKQRSMDVMPLPSEPQKKEQPSTYFVQDRKSEQELARLAIKEN